MLTNNSTNMKTVVETFIVEETASLIYDNEHLDIWNKRVEELGLQGQTKIVKKDKSPIPFLWMNQSLLNIIETLCPRKVSIEAYDKMPIPIEILELVALSTRENYFDLIEIWYDDKQQDPACIGYAYKEDHRDDWGAKFYAEKYLLGRWSDVKATFAELFDRAAKRFKAEKENEYKSRIKDAQRALEDIDIETNNRFGSNASANDALPF